MHFTAEVSSTIYTYMYIKTCTVHRSTSRSKLAKLRRCCARPAPGRGGGTALAQCPLPRRCDACLESRTRTGMGSQEAQTDFARGRSRRICRRCCCRDFHWVYDSSLSNHVNGTLGGEQHAPFVANSSKYRVRRMKLSCRRPDINCLLEGGRQRGVDLGPICGWICCGRSDQYGPLGRKIEEDDH